MARYPPPSRRRSIDTLHLADWLFSLLCEVPGAFLDREHFPRPFSLPFAIFHARPNFAEAKNRLAASCGAGPGSQLPKKINKKSLLLRVRGVQGPFPPAANSSACRMRTIGRLLERAAVASCIPATASRSLSTVPILPRMAASAAPMACSTAQQRCASQEGSVRHRLLLHSAASVGRRGEGGGGGVVAVVVEGRRQGAATLPMAARCSVLGAMNIHARCFSSSSSSSPSSLYPALPGLLHPSSPSLSVVHGCAWPARYLVVPGFLDRASGHSMSSRLEPAVAVMEEMQLSSVVKKRKKKMNKHKLRKRRKAVRHKNENK